MARTLYIALFCLNSVNVAFSSSHPRMIFTDKDTTFKRLSLPAHQTMVWHLLGNKPDVVSAVTTSGHRHFYNFQKSQKNPAEGKVQWDKCSNTACDYNITVVHHRENSSLVFVCGSSGKQTLCCDMDILDPSLFCRSNEKMESIRLSIEGFINKKSEHSVLVENNQGADLYMAYSGSKDRVGIYKFGTIRVMPVSHDKEQHYAGLVLRRQKNNTLQDRVYAFYKQKNSDTELDGEMWSSFVTQVCMSDAGGPKTLLQFQWTSQLNARLFCGNRERQIIFSELVDTATVYAENWQDTKIYGLFRNEWGMSAVCVYTIRDIDNVFMTSPFKGQTPETENRPRKCVSDSRKISPDILGIIDKTSEMKDWVLSVNHSHPLLVSRLNYTHICVDPSQLKDSANTVMFLSLNDGRIHKVVENGNKPVIVAEYRPFNQTTDIDSLSLYTSSKKLYIHTSQELIQLDVANCTQYGATCQECILSRDAYCGWKADVCTSDTHHSLQDVARGDPAVCKVAPPKPHVLGHRSKDPHRNENTMSIPFQSRYFLTCPVSSHHAQYAWKRGDHETVCSSREEQCIHLIDNMSHDLEGLYQCTSNEQGYRKVLAQYQLKLQGRAQSLRSDLVLWVCLAFVLFKVFPC